MNLYSLVFSRLASSIMSTSKSTFIISPEETLCMLKDGAPLLSLAEDSLTTECAGRFAFVSKEREHVPPYFKTIVAIPLSEQLSEQLRGHLVVWVTSNSDNSDDLPITCQLISIEPVNFNIEKPAIPSRYDIIIENNVVTLYHILPGGVINTQHCIPMQPPKYTQ